MPHSEHHFTESKTLRDLVIGMSDGLTVPFALAAGLSGAAIVNHTIVTAGVAELVAGAISMGLGGYLAGKTDVEHYAGELSREQMEVKHFPELERNEIKQILSEYGISEKTQTALVDDLEKDEKKWVDFMMKFELGLEAPNPREARNSAMRIGGSYALGGAIPLMPYFLTDTSSQGLTYSVLVTSVALGFFGFLKSRVTSQPPLKGAIRVVMIGAIAAASAFYIARLISL